MLSVATPDLSELDRLGRVVLELNVITVIAGDDAGRARELAFTGSAERQRQAAGWRVVRLSMPLPDGTIPYVHIIHPVIPGADYTVMRILYDAFPKERQMLYELYRGAFAKNLSLAT